MEPAAVTVALLAGGAVLILILWLSGRSDETVARCRRCKRDARTAAWLDERRCGCGTDLDAAGVRVGRLRRAWLLCAAMALIGATIAIASLAASMHESGTLWRDYLPAHLMAARLHGQIEEEDAQSVIERLRGGGIGRPTRSGADAMLRALLDGADATKPGILKYRRELITRLLTTAQSDEETVKKALVFLAQGFVPCEANDKGAIEFGGQILDDACVGALLLRPRVAHLGDRQCEWKMLPQALRQTWIGGDEGSKATILDARAGETPVVLEATVCWVSCSPEALVYMKYDDPQEWSVASLKADVTLTLDVSWTGSPPPVADADASFQIPGLSIRGPRATATFARPFAGRPPQEAWARSLAAASGGIAAGAALALAIVALPTLLRGRHRLTRPRCPRCDHSVAEFPRLGSTCGECGAALIDGDLRVARRARLSHLGVVLLTLALLVILPASMWITWGAARLIEPPLQEAMVAEPRYVERKLVEWTRQRDLDRRGEVDNAIARLPTMAAPRDESEWKDIMVWARRVAEGAEFAEFRQTADQADWMRFATLDPVAFNRPHRLGGSKRVGKSILTGATLVVVDRGGIDQLDLELCGMHQSEFLFGARSVPKPADPNQPHWEWTIDDGKAIPIGITKELGVSSTFASFARAPLPQTVKLKGVSKPDGGASGAEPSDSFTLILRRVGVRMTPGEGDEVIYRVGGGVGTPLGY